MAVRLFTELCEAFRNPAQGCHLYVVFGKEGILYGWARQPQHVTAAAMNQWGASVTDPHPVDIGALRQVVEAMPEDKRQQLLALIDDDAKKRKT